MGPDRLAYRAGLHSARPADNHRNANAAFIKITFDSAQDTMTGEKIRIHSALPVRAVVAGEEDNSLIVETELSQSAGETPYIAVHAHDHRGLRLLVLRPLLTGELAEVGNLHPSIFPFIIRVRDRISQ